MRTYVKTRRLSMAQLQQMSLWLDHNCQKPALIRGAAHQRFIQQYVAEMDNGWPVHEVQVEFSCAEDVEAFQQVWS